MIVPDLNLLVCARTEGAPLHEPARRWWESRVNGTERVGVPWIVAAGFVRLLTHPNVLPDPTPPDQAVDLMAEWIRSPSVSSLNPGTQHPRDPAPFARGRLLAAVCSRPPMWAANLVTDAHIAALAIEHQVQVHPNDSDFARFPGLRGRNPL